MTDELQARRQRRSTPRPGSGKPRSIDYDRVKALTAEGKTAAQIAETLGCSTSSINQIRGRLGITNPNHFLTPERLAQIESMLDDGWPFAEITRTTGTAFETLQAHFPGRQWTIEQRTEHARALRASGEAWKWNSYRSGKKVAA